MLNFTEKQEEPYKKTFSFGWGNKIVRQWASMCAKYSVWNGQ